MKKTRFMAMLLALVMIFSTFCSMGMTAMAASEKLGTVTVTGSAVNVRSGAGTNNSRLGVVYRGNVYDVLDSAKDGTGTTWYKIEYAASKSGYISGQYTAFSGMTNNSVPDEKIGTITVTGSVVNVRSGAGTNNSKIGTLSSGSVRDVVGTAKAGDGRVWYKIILSGSTTGYITSQYTKFVANASVPNTTTTTTTGTTGLLITTAPASTTTAATTTTKTTTTTAKATVPAKYANALRPNGSTKASYFKGLSGTQAFIDSIALLAVYEMETNDVLASVTIAQAILESSSGKSRVAQNKNNLFGIMTGPSTYKSYSNVQDCFASHSKVLKQSYYNNSSRKVIGNRDYKSVVKALVGVYATDPNYGTKLLSLIKEYNLTKYDNMTCADFGYSYSGSSTTSKTTTASSATGTVKVTCDTLRVRSGAGTNYTKLGCVYRGETYKYSATKTVNGTTWYCIKYNGDTGWISGDYAKRI